MALMLTTYQLGAPRQRGEGLRIGVVRRPPRGVRKEDYAPKDYYDIWLPLLAPSAGLLSWIHSQDADNAAIWQRFVARYRREMRNNGDAWRTILLLARLAQRTPLAIGCHCADETRCHRSVLRELIEEAASQ